MRADVTCRVTMHKRIHIIGGSGAGKTSLAESIADNYGIPLFELDEIFWSSTNEDIYQRPKRNEEERNEILSNIVKSEKWILEGVSYKWLSLSFVHADLIIVLDINRWLRLYRVAKRTVRACTNAPSDVLRYAREFLEIALFNHSYNEMHLKPTLDMLMPYNEKVMLCKNSKEALNAISM